MKDVEGREFLNLPSCVVRVDGEGTVVISDWEGISIPKSEWTEVVKFVEKRLKEVLV